MLKSLLNKPELIYVSSLTFFYLPHDVQEVLVQWVHGMDLHPLPTIAVQLEQ